MLKTLSSILGLLVCSSCVQLQAIRPEEVVSPVKINNGELDQGREMEIRGYLATDRCLYQSEAELERWLKAFDVNAEDFDPSSFNKYRLTINYDSSSVNNVDSLIGHVVTIRGTIQYNYLDGERLDLGACSPNAVNARSIQALD